MRVVVRRGSRSRRAQAELCVHARKRYIARITIREQGTRDRSEKNTCVENRVLSQVAELGNAFYLKLISANPLPNALHLQLAT